MTFNEYKEYKNPLERDFDLRSSLRDDETESNINPYEEELMELIGFVEDISNEQMIEQYGITLYEYYEPTEETIIKVKQKLGKSR